MAQQRYFIFRVANVIKIAYLNPEGSGMCLRDRKYELWHHPVDTLAEALAAKQEWEARLRQRNGR
jgi:hypothetical protein